MSAASDLGATLEGVKDLLPTLAIDGASSPSSDAVQRMLEKEAANVMVRVGERLRQLMAAAVGAPVLADDVANVTTFAAALAELATASLTADAAWPERADTQQTDTSLAAGFRAQFTAGMKSLEDALDRLLADNLSADRHDPAVSAPCPYFSTTMRL